MSGVLLGIVDCVSAPPHSLETQHFLQQVGSSKLKNGRQLNTPKEVRYT